MDQNQAFLTFELLINDSASLFIEHEKTKGKSTAMVDLGIMRFHGLHGLKKNEKLAFEWFEKASDMNSSLKKTKIY